MLKNLVLKKRIESQGLGLALGGGSVRGFFHIGLLRALEEHKIPISYIAGISVGSMVGGLYAYGYNSNAILEIFNEQSKTTNLLTAATPSLFNGQGMFSGEKMIDIFNKLVFNSKIEDFRIPFSCRAIDIQNFKEVIFDSGDAGKAIKASCSVPGVFTPEENEESDMLVDGGMLGPVPFELLQNNFDGPKLAANIISFDNISQSQAEEFAEDLSKNVIYKLLPVSDVLLRTFYIMQSYVSSLEVEKYNPDLYVEFKGSYNPSITNINEVKDRLVLDGYNETMKALKEIGF